MYLYLLPYLYDNRVSYKYAKHTQNYPKYIHNIICVSDTFCYIVQYLR